MAAPPPAAVALPNTADSIRDYLEASSAADYFTAAGGAQIVLPDTTNGPDEAGLAAAGSDLLKASAKLDIYPSYVHMLCALKYPVSIPDSLIRVFRPAAVLVAKRALWKWTSGTTVVIDGDVNVFSGNPAAFTATATDHNGMTEEAARAFLQSISRKDVQEAWLLIYATKTSWWMTNHHTGVGGLQGITKKAAGLIGLDGSDAAVVEAIHTLGHWASTKLILLALGVTGIESATANVVDGFPSRPQTSR